MQFFNRVMAWLSEEPKLNLEALLNRSERENKFYAFLDRVLFGEPVNLDYFLEQSRKEKLPQWTLETNIVLKTN
ncbi:Hypothetical protein BRZCDTV_126 [Brazilian cedratvirus IHUMI]|uniref:Uncharacterized protein n=1 Tax=Brazilian cedratvirus IHUMI TaxID=2126980 RepID=A0A2R8FDF9_9VIRU|nr:Hypothetical protein BRZCDTV_126 [Brazilian cedratvirus IHUMI]